MTASTSDGLPWVGRSRWLSVVAIVAVNLIPVVLLLNRSWEPGDVLVAYWLENVVVGGFSLVKIMTARGTAPDGTTGMTLTTTRRIGGRRTQTVQSADSARGRGALAACFTVHFGLFTLVHGVFTALLAWSIGVAGSARGWLLMVVALGLSHGLSLVLHWFGGGERDRVSPGQAMMAPYGRIVVLHLVVLGGFFVVFRGFGAGETDTSSERFLPAIALIVIKTGLDVVTHLREHRVDASPPPPA